MPFVKVDIAKENEKFNGLLEDKENQIQYELFEKEYELKSYVKMVKDIIESEVSKGENA